MLSPINPKQTDINYNPTILLAVDSGDSTYVAPSLGG